MTYLLPNDDYMLQLSIILSIILYLPNIYHVNKHRYASQPTGRLGRWSGRQSEPQSDAGQSGRTRLVWTQSQSDAAGRAGQTADDSPANSGGEGAHERGVSRLTGCRLCWWTQIFR